MNPARLISWLRGDPIARLDDRIEGWFQKDKARGMVTLAPVALAIVAVIVMAFWAYYG